MTGNSMVICPCLNPVLDATTVNPGGAINTAVTINGYMANELHFSVPSLPSGQGDQLQHSKFFILNSHGTDTADGAKFWAENVGDAWSYSGAPRGQGTDAADDDGKYLRFIGRDVDGNSLQSPQTCDGTNEIIANDMFSDLFRVESRDSITNLLTPMVGPYYIKSPGGVILAVIPDGCCGAVWEFDHGLYLAGLGDSLAIVGTCETPPAGIVFPTTRARSSATALNCANGGVIGPGQSNSGWSRWRVKERAKPSKKILVSMVIRIAIDEDN